MTGVSGVAGVAGCVAAGTVGAGWPPVVSGVPYGFNVVGVGVVGAVGVGVPVGGCSAVVSIVPLLDADGVLAVVCVVG